MTYVILILNFTISVISYSTLVISNLQLHLQSQLTKCAFSKHCIMHPLIIFSFDEVAYCFS